MFKKCGQFIFDGSVYSEDEMMEAALEAGAQDVRPEAQHWVVTSEPMDFTTVLDAFDKAGLKYQSAEFTMVAENTVRVAGKEARQVMRLLDKLEDLDDVMKVHANYEIDDAEMERILGD